MLRKDKKSAVDTYLPFEKELAELEAKLETLESEEERARLEAEIARRRDELFANLTPWQRIQLARHPGRPKMLDYTTRVFDDMLELHGDRLGHDDPAMVGGVARIDQQTVVVVGQQKGATTEERISRNFGMARPEGYRKAMRLFFLAERLRLPVVTFVDTPAADLHPDAESRGQAVAIAENLRVMAGLRTPVLSVVLGEGGSGGALGIAVADRVVMLEHAIYVICPPERCAEILWRDKEKKELAAEALRVTAKDLYELGVADAVLPEPPGGAHRNPDEAARVVADEIRFFLRGCRRGEYSVARRQEKYRRMGQWEEEVQLKAKEA